MVYECMLITVTVGYFWPTPVQLCLFKSSFLRCYLILNNILRHKTFNKM